MSLASLTQALQSAGIEAFGISMPVLAQDWTPAGGSTPSYAADDSTMVLTISGGNWAAPCAAAMLVVDPGNGRPLPVTLTNADGSPQTSGGVLLTVFEAAWLRLGRLYASVLETASAARPEQAAGLPVRQVPRYFFYPGQTSATTDGMAQVRADLGFGDDLRIYDNDGLPIDPVAVMAAFTALMTANLLLQSDTPSVTPQLGKYLASLAPDNEIRVRVVSPGGEPYSGSLLTGLTAVSGATGTGQSTVSQGTPVQVKAVSQGFTADDRNRVVLGPATSGRLTDSFSSPSLPAGLPMPRDFFTLNLVQLKNYVLGTMPPADPATVPAAA